MIRAVDKKPENITTKHEKSERRGKNRKTLQPNMKT
jgi:hypothetical protein